MMSLGTSTEVLGKTSTARLSVVSAALSDGERRLQPVAERQPELRHERSVVDVPVREEVTAVPFGHRPEAIVAHGLMLGDEHRSDVLQTDIP